MKTCSEQQSGGQIRVRAALRLAVYVGLALSWAVRAHAWTLMPTTVADLTRSAAHVFRGQCVTAQVGTAEVAGARIPVTTYTFRVHEHLKGVGPDTLTFRQIGTPKRGPRDLGRLAGLPVYAPGTEYVLFLLPESRASLTSPAGVSQGAFIVSGEQVRGMYKELGVQGAPAPTNRTASAQASPPGVEPMSYEALRRAVLDQVGR